MATPCPSRPRWASTRLVSGAGCRCGPLPRPTIRSSPSPRSTTPCGGARRTPLCAEIVSRVPDRIERVEVVTERHDVVARDRRAPLAARPFGAGQLRGAMSPVTGTRRVTAVLRRAEAWLLVSAPAERLAVLRILAGTFAVAYLLVRLPGLPGPGRRTGALLPPRRFALAPRRSVVGDDRAGPRARRVRARHGVHRIPASGSAGLGRPSPSRSPALHLPQLVGAAAALRESDGPAGADRGLRAERGRARALGACRGHTTTVGPIHAAYGGPVRLAAGVTVLTYVLAGVAKLRLGGLGWMVGDTLRNHVAYSAARLDLLGGTPSPLGKAPRRAGVALPPARHRDRAHRAGRQAWRCSAAGCARPGSWPPGSCTPASHR